MSYNLWPSHAKSQYEEAMVKCICSSESQRTICGKMRASWISIVSSTSFSRQTLSLADGSCVSFTLNIWRHGREHIRADIRTYGVVTLNEECGFIQWVPNTIPVRPVLLKAYETRGVKPWVRLKRIDVERTAQPGLSFQSPEMSDMHKRTQILPDKDAANVFLTKILPM
jgi:hypothetical protein